MSENTEGTITSRKVEETTVAAAPVTTDASQAKTTAPVEETVTLTEVKEN